MSNQQATNDIDQLLPKNYDPKAAESKWYPYWIEKGFFKAERDPQKRPFTIVIPPPNVTGKLHLGHALDTTLQDIITRTKRMQGYSALFLPGMDHAGIATQARVEATLREEGISRHDLGREKFLEKVWEWKHIYAEHIREQWEKLGLALDYSRERFTMDEGLSRAVREVFVRLYEKGLIYRGNRIINWDPAARTALSDIEVIYKEVKGALHHMRYPLADGSGYIEVATTRPETMLGDTAVAVHPEDERYKHLIGKTVILPIVGREIPIVADDYVDPEFGSGAVKITPAHDPNDFELGQRHQLPQIVVMDESGTMNENAAGYKGLDRFECRKQIIKDLTEQGVMFKIEEHIHQVGHSERSDAVVEPYLSTQWFVKMQPLADAAIANAYSEDSVKFVPERFKTNYLRWIENIRDWCISRQLWWGHRIPAWYCQDCSETIVSREDAGECPHCHSHQLVQDQDVLDTWFSSALWPFSTLGWPEETEDMKYFYPTNVLVTGYDIIFFWVARMIFSGLEFTGKNPFDTVLIHGIIRDSEGRKMSKSLGNGVDPMEVIEKYGADALRFTLATGNSPGNDQRFYWEKVEANRNFANKIWNASRFALMNLTGFGYEDIDLSGNLSTPDKWVLSRLQATIKDVTRLMDAFEFGEAGRVLYNFIWDDLCDWYIEMAKLPLYGNDEAAKKTTQSVLVTVLDQTLRLLHPFMPYMTEEIWQALPHQGESITVAAWPTVNEQLIFPDAEAEMNLLVEVIRSVRNIRAEVNVPMSKKIELLIKPGDSLTLERLQRGEEYLVRFCNPERLEISEQLKTPDKAMSAVVSGAELFLPLAGLIDLDQEVKRLEKELATLHGEVERIEKKLNNPGFMAKAPEKVVEEERAKMAGYMEKREKVMARLSELKGE
ncbi:valine--tRNA ligase [Brevibacillus borstelensis]|uniref:valine--tRNA ligase n=1 Tax=Brevibacillus borstelensis TaxID=45462 RepID=UPI000F084ACD|nr:valine--tRNA ligase [Brevibacillus borstelensis]MED1743571.1 valine--tRNA ligase [Brevibacillus borstelensis]MED1884725.1 valine--tRNA ligase [Brevibacillus borstelensis]RNB63672.1 valine--tRNA ligase [Brevibacillus borstelensis]GED50842.1 valine--tRNA ligase [Brevibacillus borstelensis]